VTEEKVTEAAADLSRVIDALETIIRGKREFLSRVVAAFLADGHILIEDVPGTGKTTAAKTMSRLVKGLSFQRIQFTPDLLPYDITGVDVWDTSKEDFVFRPGPLFAGIVLADEINRTTPKVQSALLEVMAENQVTVGNHTYPMERPFFVMATQNPVEMEGTYPLPAAQMDRFLMKITPGYPDSETEFMIVRDNPSAFVLPDLKPVTDKKQWLALQKLAGEVFCDDRLIRCAVAIGEKTRTHKGVRLGVSTRGILMLVAACRALALVRGRGYVIDQDLADLAVPVLAHRIILRGTEQSAEEIITEVTTLEISRIKH
jgi:MoxR-like ATPase